MAWGYRLEAMGARDGALCRQEGRTCAASRCGKLPQFVSAYRYSRTGGKAVTASRPLCVSHARLFSMRYSLAWPNLLRRARRPLGGPMTAGWIQLAA